MPADVTGYELLGRGEDSQGPKMVFRPGPVFANLVLADEINRAAPKTQSALLEAMAERHVTVGGQTYPLEEPFLVAATQNPIEQEGTYPLPEAQLDRFMMEIRIGYPSPAAGGRDRDADDLGRAEAAGGGADAGGVPAASRPGAGGAGGAERGRRGGAAVRREPARRSPAATFVKRLRGLGRRPARFAEPRPGGQGPGACWSAAAPPTSKTSRRWPCRSCGTASS